MEKDMPKEFKCETCKYYNETDIDIPCSHHPETCTEYVEYDGVSN